MRRVVHVLLLGILVVGISLILAAVPGRVTAEIGSWSIDFSTQFAVVVLLVLAVLTHLLLGLIRLPGRVGGLFSRRSRRKGDLATTRALVALAAADPASARKEATRARRLLGDTPQTLLLTAEAARLAGREEDATEALSALAQHEHASFLGLRGQLRQAIAKSDWPAATEVTKTPGLIRLAAVRLDPRLDWIVPELVTVAPTPVRAPAAMIRPELLTPSLPAPLRSAKLRPAPALSVPLLVKSPPTPRVRAPLSALTVSALARPPDARMVMPPLVLSMPADAPPLVVRAPLSAVRAMAPGACTPESPRPNAPCVAVRLRPAPVE